MVIKHGDFMGFDVDFMGFLGDFMVIQWDVLVIQRDLMVISSHLKGEIMADTFWLIMVNRC